MGQGQKDRQFTGQFDVIDFGAKYPDQAFAAAVIGTRTPALLANGPGWLTELQGKEVVVTGTVEKWFGRTINRIGRYLTYACYTVAAAILIRCSENGTNRRADGRTGPPLSTGCWNRLKGSSSLI